MTDPTIIYTLTDEAPALATYSFLPVVRAYASTAGVDVETRDISLAGRIIAAFPERLTQDQRIADALAELGELAKTPEANIIKLPNISASIPQLKAAIAELQQQGLRAARLPGRPEVRRGPRRPRALRQGQGQRRQPGAARGQLRPPRARLGQELRQRRTRTRWARGRADSKTNVAHMGADDFRSTEQSVVIAEAGSLRIELRGDDGSTTVLRESVPVIAGEVVDASVMRVAALREFLAAQVARAKAEGVLFSVHLKATMMKVSDPIIFGHAVRAFFPKTFAAVRRGARRGRPEPERRTRRHLQGPRARCPTGAQIKASFEAELAEGPALAMVDSDRGITNLHVPSDVIVDASMPAMIRTSGHMWGPDGKEADTLAVIPDSSYAGVYQVVIDDCRANGAFDPATMGSVPNVGLMAQAAEEYGSHDKTFEIPTDGTVRVVDDAGNVVLEQPVRAGDIFRMCQTKDVPIRDWVKLAVTRARATGDPAVFWLDEDRAHDANLIAKVKAYLPEHDTDGLQIEIMSPERGDGVLAGAHPPRREHHLGHRQRAARLPDRPVPDPGARHQRQDAVDRPADRRAAACSRPAPAAPRPSTCSSCSRRTTCAGTAWASSSRWRPASSTWRRPPATRAPRSWPTRSTGRPARSSTRTSRRAASSAASTTAAATSTWRCTGRRSWPGRPTTRELAEAFAALAKTLAEQEQTIVDELIAVQGSPADIGGYYQPDPVKAAAVMRPSKTFNAALATLG